MRPQGYLLLALPLWAGCAAVPPTAAAPQALSPARNPVWVFDCGEQRLEVEVRGPKEVWVSGPGISKGLSQVRSASGVRYADAESELWTKGPTARFTQRNLKLTGCVRNEGEEPWAQARRAGVDFRAQGTAPDWVLEVGRQTGLTLTRPSQEDQHWPYDDPSEDPAALKSFFGVGQGEGGQDIDVELVAAPCKEPASGKLLDTTVSIQLGDTELQGCGKGLNK